MSTLARLAEIERPPVLDLESAAEAVSRSCAGLAAEGDRLGAFPAREFDAIRSSGLLTAPLGRDLGGLGLGVEPGSTARLLSILRIIGRGNLSVGRIYEGHVNALLLIDRFGSPDRRRRFAADARDGRIFGVWNTDDPASAVSIAPIGAGRHRLVGAKVFASGAGAVDRPFANATLPDGSRLMVVVPMEDVDPAMVDADHWRASGMRASRSGRVDFSGVEVDESCLIGRPGDYLREPWFSGGAIRFAAVQLGGAEALVSATIAYLRGLGRTGDPHQRRRVGEMAVALTSGVHWLESAGAMADRPASEARRIVAHANMTRTAIESICLEIRTLAERSVGARGLLPPHPIERIARDLTLYLRQPAPDGALDDVGCCALDGEVNLGDLVQAIHPA